MTDTEGSFPDAMFKAVIDSLPERVAIIDAEGTILYVNPAWSDYGCRNGLCSPGHWPGRNYIQVCLTAAARGDPDADRAAAGIRGVIRGERPDFYLEYPGHAPDAQHWFMMRAVPLRWDGPPRCIISHHEITERKLTEERIEAMAYLDGLTGIANRRYFDIFLNQEWRRAARLQTPLALIMLDIDHFKPFNDHYGHQAGDDCLRRIGQLLKGFAQRAGDMAARYGGEEFALILANTQAPQAAQIAEEVCAAILGLSIPHAFSAFDQRLTVSLGVAVAHPGNGEPPSSLIAAADHALYAAKTAGRNRVANAPPSPPDPVGGTM